MQTHDKAGTVGSNPNKLFGPGPANQQLLRFGYALAVAGRGEADGDKRAFYRKVAISIAAILEREKSGLALCAFVNDLSAVFNQTPGNIEGVS